MGSVSRVDLKFTDTSEDAGVDCQQNSNSECITKLVNIPYKNLLVPSSKVKGLVEVLEEVEDKHECNIKSVEGGISLDEIKQHIHDIDNRVKSEEEIAYDSKVEKLKSDLLDKEFGDPDKFKDLGDIPEPLNPSENSYVKIKSEIDKLYLNEFTDEDREQYYKNLHLDVQEVFKSDDSDRSYRCSDTFVSGGWESVDNNSDGECDHNPIDTFLKEDCKSVDWTAKCLCKDYEEKYGSLESNPIESVKDYLQGINYDEIPETLGQDIKDEMNKGYREYKEKFKQSEGILDEGMKVEDNEWFKKLSNIVEIEKVKEDCVSSDEIDEKMVESMKSNWDSELNKVDDEIKSGNEFYTDDNRRGDLTIRDKSYYIKNDPYLHKQGLDLAYKWRNYLSPIEDGVIKELAATPVWNNKMNQDKLTLDSSLVDQPVVDSNSTLSDYRNDSLFKSDPEEIEKEYIEPTPKSIISASETGEFVMDEVIEDVSLEGKVEKIFNINRLKHSKWFEQLDKLSEDMKIDGGISLDKIDEKELSDIIIKHWNKDLADEVLEEDLDDTPFKHESLKINGDNIAINNLTNGGLNKRGLGVAYKWRNYLYPIEDHVVKNLADTPEWTTKMNNDKLTLNESLVGKRIEGYDELPTENTTIGVRSKNEVEVYGLDNSLSNLKPKHDDLVFTDVVEDESEVITSKLWNTYIDHVKASRDLEPKDIRILTGFSELVVINNIS